MQQNKWKNNENRNNKIKVKLWKTQITRWNQNWLWIKKIVKQIGNQKQCGSRQRQRDFSIICCILNVDWLLINNLKKKIVINIIIGNQKQCGNRQRQRDLKTKLIVNLQRDFSITCCIWNWWSIEKKMEC